MLGGRRSRRRRGRIVEAIGSAIRATSPPPTPQARRAEDVVLAVAARAGGAEPVFQRRAVEPIFRRPPVEASQQRREGEAATPRPQAAREPPPFEWLDLEIIPYGQKPDPRGYAVYAQRPRPEPAPVVLIDAAV